MKLLVRRIPVVSECLADYAARLADDNGHRTAGRLYAALRSEESARRLLDVPFEQLLAMDLRLSAGVVMWKEAIFDTAVILRRTAGICSLCLAENGHRPLNWRSWWKVACTHHSTLLTDHCDACGAALNLLVDTATHCRCGFDLRRAKQTVPVCDAFLSFQSAVDAAFASQAGFPSSTALGHPALTLLSAPGGLGLLAHATTLITDGGARTHGPALPTVQARLYRIQTLEPHFRNGGESLIGSWRARLSNVYRERREGVPHRSDLEHLRRMKRWCMNAEPGSPLHTFGMRLHEEWRDVERSASLAPLANNASGSTRAAMLTVSQASTSCGIPEARLRWLIDRQLVPATRGLRCGRGRARLVSAAVVGQLGAFRMKLLSRKETAALLDISELQVTALFTLGALRCAWGGRKSHRAEIPLEQVSRLLSRLASLATTDTAPSQTRSLAAVASLDTRGLRVFAETVLAALRGKIPVYRAAGEPRGLRQWVVGRDSKADRTMKRK